MKVWLPSALVASMFVLAAFVGCRTNESAEPAAHRGTAAQPGPVAPEKPPVPGAESTGIELFVTPPNGLHFEAALTLGELLERYTRLMGWSLLAPDDTRKALDLTACDVPAGTEVAPERVHGFVEGLVLANGFALGFAHREEPVVLRVDNLANPGRPPLIKEAVLVPASELPRWATHPAHMISTLVNVPGRDAEKLANSLQRVFSAVLTQQVIPVGDSGTLLLTAMASDVAALVKVIEQSGPGQTAYVAASPIAGPRALDLFRVPAQPLRLEKPEKGELTLHALLEQYAQLMGWRLILSRDNRAQTDSLRCTLALPLEVAPQEVHSFVESVLVANDFVLDFPHKSEPVLLRVQSLHTPERANLVRNAVLVPASELAEWAAHPAHLVATELALPGVDVKTLSNSLRQMFTDSQTQQLVPIGDERVFAVGFGPELAGIASLLTLMTPSAQASPVFTPSIAPARTGVELFAAPPKPLHLENPRAGEKRRSEDLTLYALLEQYTQLMGWRLLMSHGTQQQTDSLRCTFDLPLDVPPDQVHGFVESVMSADGFVFHFAHVGEPVLLEVGSLNSPSRGNLRKDAAVVPVSELGRWAEHPAHLVTTMFDLPGVDVRTLSNSLRQMFTDAQTQQIIPVGNSNGLIVTGFGADVLSLGRMFESLVDAAKPGAQAPRLELPALTSGVELFAAPATPLHLQASKDGVLTLQQLLDAYAQLMGWRLLVSRDTGQQLVTLHCDIGLPVEVPPQQVHAFVEGILSANEFTFSFAHTSKPVLLKVESTNVPSKGNLRRDAAFVASTELARWADHPAHLITTQLVLPGLDVRTLSNSMRQMFTDAQTQQIIPVGNSDGLILTGPGTEIVGLAGMFAQLVQAKNSSAPIAPFTLPPQSSGIELFVVPAKALHLEAPLSVASLLDQYVRLMGWRLIASREVRQMCESTPCDFTLPLDVAPESVHAFVEGILRANHCVLSFAHTRSPVLLSLERTDLRGQPNLSARTPIVPMSELARWADHPAFLVSAIAALPGLDVRGILNGLHGWATDGQLQLVLTLGERNGLLLSGRASDVARVLGALGEMSRDSASALTPSSTKLASPDRARLFPLGTSDFRVESHDGHEPSALSVLEALGNWTQRPLRISDEARAVLAVASGKSTQELLVMEPELVYPFVETLLDRMGCTLSPWPHAAPTHWVVERADAAKGGLVADLPTIPLEELDAWSGYCATPFRTYLRLPESVDPARVNAAVRVLFSGSSASHALPTGDRVLVVSGTPKEIQSAVGVILQACEPAAAKK